MLEPLTLDRLGRPRTSMMDPALRRGRRPPNYGRTFPAEILSSAEVGRLLAACPRRGSAGARNRVAIVLMWRCGLRIGEVLGQVLKDAGREEQRAHQKRTALTARDVDLDQGVVTVRHGKGDKRRLVGMDPGTVAIVAEWLSRREKLGIPRSAPLVCTITRGDGLGAPLGHPYMRDALKRYAARAGIEKRVHPHGLRHTYATELLREGKSFTVIQKLLGHNDLKTTAVYLDHLFPGEAIEAAQGRVWPEGLAA